MAYLDATDWLDLQSSAATNEKRAKKLGLVNSVKDSTAGVDYIPPSEMDKMRSTSSLRNLQLPVLKDQNVTVVQTPGFNFIPSNLPESDKYSFSAVDVFTGFRFYPAQYDNNQIDADWAKMEVMKNVDHAAASTIESLLSTTLEARKTQLLDGTVQVNQGSGTYTFDAGTDTLQVNKAAQNETMFAALEQLMDINKLSGDYRLVTSPGGLYTQKVAQAKYGANNQMNLEALGIFGADRIYESHNISAGSDVFNGYFFRDGALGVVENYPYDFRNGTEFAGKKWSISDVELPFSRMRANIYVNNEATEATSLVGAGSDSNMIMTHFEEMAIWFRFYIVHRYNSDLTTRANDIVKLKGLTT
jgi:hypothetical protein